MTVVGWGRKGQVVIPKEIRDKTGIRAGSDVVVEMRGDEVLIKKSAPPAKSYFDYYIASHSKKLKRKINTKSIVEKEDIERARIR